MILEGPVAARGMKDYMMFLQWEGCISHLVLRGTYSGRPFPAPQPVLCQQESALLPTSAPAAERDLPYVCLKTKEHRS